MTSYEENPRLKDFFSVLALSLDNKGLPYISLMEANKVRVGYSVCVCVCLGGRGIESSACKVGAICGTPPAVVCVSVHSATHPNTMCHTRSRSLSYSHSSLPSSLSCVPLHSHNPPPQKKTVPRVCNAVAP